MQYTWESITSWKVSTSGKVRYNQETQNTQENSLSGKSSLNLSAFNPSPCTPGRVALLQGQEGQVCFLAKMVGHRLWGLSRPGLKFLLLPFGSATRYLVTIISSLSSYPLPYSSLPHCHPCSRPYLTRHLHQYP